ncbi:hypothetical protein JYP51_10045 [Ponticoccus gilvus]|nr:hypothetical protein [Enemella evansiae]
MRPVLPGDVSAAARALLAVAPEGRAALAQRLLTEAAAADRYRRRFRRAHPDWGNGTLRAAALAHPVAAEPRLDDRDHLDCQFLVIEALLARAVR